MQHRWQFSTQYLLMELSLIALALGLGRLAWTSYSRLSNGVEAMVFAPAFYGMLACFGAAMGGFFGKPLSGVFWAIGVFWTGYFLIAAGMVVYTVVFA